MGVGWVRYLKMEDEDYDKETFRVRGAHILERVPMDVCMRSFVGTHVVWHRVAEDRRWLFWSFCLTVDGYFVILFDRRWLFWSFCLTVDGYFDDGFLTHTRAHNSMWTESKCRCGPSQG